MKLQDGDVHKDNNDWFMFLEDHACCLECDNEVNDSRWINIQKAIDTITSQKNKQVKE